MTTFALMSDLHLERQKLQAMPTTQADVLLLAGDIGQDSSLHHLYARYPQVYQVMGNHDFWDEYGALDDIADHKNTFSPANVEIVHAFRAMSCASYAIGICTMWSRLTGEQKRRLPNVTNDCRYIRHMSPDHWEQQNSWHQDALENFLATPYGVPKIVMTHYIPLEECTDPEYQGDPDNFGWVTTGIEEVLAELPPQCRPAVWCFGHTHASCDKTVYGTRFLCNPQGYYTRKGWENPNFNPNLTFTI